VRRLLHTAMAVIVATWAVMALAAAPAAATTGAAAALAAANIGKTAGTCAVQPTVNSLGGDQFTHSCSGNSSGPEYWCADFGIWVWNNAGLNTAGLTAAADSFVRYGRSHGTFHNTAQPGDAVTFAKDGIETHHVGIVTAVGADGSVTVANGDWGGDSGHGMEHFAVTSAVVAFTIPASQASMGSYVDKANQFITAFVGPAGTGNGGSAPPDSGGSPYSPVGLCGTGYGVIDSHDLGAARIFLLYEATGGRNCVVTIADADAGAVTMNATLVVQGGSGFSDLGLYHWYAGPVRALAPGDCVKWGGTYGNTTWTSDYEHCGSGGGPSAPWTENPYTASGLCGTGFSIVDQHPLSGATVYLLYNGSSGNNCVVTLASDILGKSALASTLAVQGGTSTADSGTYTYYAGPIIAHAPNSCVMWGGTHNSSSWTSGWGHCGSDAGGAAGNPYTPAGVCGTGYAVIDQHDLGAATVYLLYSAGKNCVVTLVDRGSSAVGLNATLSVQGGSTAENPGLFQWYAGPVRLAAASACVKWGGSYERTSWTSGWSHCG
jgi:hypothetical protein